MPKKAFIIHGWGGYPEEGWFPWLKKELETKGFIVEVPTMPNTDAPEISAWISFLKERVLDPDEETYFVGHSIGCQTILRFLETLPEKTKIGGVVMVAGWMTLTPETTEEEGAEEIAKPWLKTKINWNKIKTHTKNFIAIFSDNDPDVPQDNADFFKEKLDAKIHLEHNKGHFTGEDNVKKLPVVLKELLKLT